MSALFQAFRRRFQANWTSLLIGWHGFGRLRRLVTISDIRQFALEKLEFAPQPDRNLIELATISEANEDAVEPCLERLASADLNDREIEVHKWVICLLEKQLLELPNDPIYGLLELTEFWAALDFPDYSPHQVQGKGNTVNPGEYYSQENYARAVEQHRNWIEQESLKLSGLTRASGSPLTN
jgi:uncharacterized protein DUF2247